MTEGEEVLVKAASSFTDRDGALKNLKAEIPHWDFGQTCTELRQMWEKHLSAIDVETERLADKEMFYGDFVHVLATADRCLAQRRVRHNARAFFIAPSEILCF